MKTLEFPLAKITLFFAAGILSAFYAKPALITALVLLSATFGGFCLAYHAAEKSFIQNIYFGISAFTLSFMLGVAVQLVHTGGFGNKNYIRHCIQKDRVHALAVVLREKLKSSAYYDRYTVTVNYLDGMESSGKLLLNLKKGNDIPKVGIGSKICFSGLVQQLRPPLNPGQFDYAGYLARKSIPAQAYTDAAHIRISRKKDKDAWYFAAGFRETIIKNLKKSNLRDQELQVAVALILGQQQDISKEVLHDYQFAGAIHVLSVSGLHIGFILLFINFILSPLPKNTMGNIMRFAITVICLWSFAIIAGLSPSVVRSVTMFSFITFGMCLKRETDIFHTLLVSILLILTIEPSFLFDIGFQLSYISLFFILWLQPALSRLMKPRGIILKYIWDIITVSFAAQIGTMPLSIYYFHQFPGLFFVTNLIILPGLGVIMAIGVLVMLMAAFGYVPGFPSEALGLLIRLLNNTIHYIASFKQFIISDIPLNTIMLLISYLAIISAIIWIKTPGYRPAFMTCLLASAFQASIIFTAYRIQYQKECIVFHAKKNTIITQRIGNRITVFDNSSILGNDGQKSMLDPYCIANFSNIVAVKKIGNIQYFNNKRILVLDSCGVYPAGINPDIIVITQSPKINFERLLEVCRPKVVVADGSNYKTYVAEWKATASKKKIPFHATAEKGFYKI